MSKYFKINRLKITTRRLSLGLFVFCALPAVLFAQYGWNFKYLTDKTTHWGHLASGDTLAIARLRFSKAVSSDPTQYRLTHFGVRPLTNHATWLVDRLQLWKDDGDGKFTQSDTFLIGLDPTTIPPQSVPTRVVSASIDTTLQDNQMLFIVAIVRDWRNSDPDNIEIDTSAAGPDGAWFSVVDSLKDLVVTPDVTKNLNSYSIQHFPIQAKNLPVTVHNPNPSAAEDDSIRLNMFYPNFTARSSASKSQRLDDLSFAADIYLPSETGGEEMKLESATLDFGFDNSILSLESLEAGDVWGADAYFYVSDTLYMTDETISGQPNYAIYHCEYSLNNSLTDTTTWREFNHDTATVVRLNFKVLKPGISPIFIMNEDLRDHYGIRYHTYRTLQNSASADYSPTTESYDAWAKYILGDWTRSTGGSKAGLNEIGDGRITAEDITLFSIFIWKNPNESDWYDRFDIGSAATHDPDELIPDDTTNFYDLMVLAKNYSRTNNGAFNQKIAVVPPHAVELMHTAANSTQTQFTLKISDAARINAIHARLHFDPEITGLAGVSVLTNSSAKPLLLYPDEFVSDGILDLNLFRLDATLGVDDQILQIDLKSRTTTEPVLILDSLEIRGADWSVSAYNFGNLSESQTVADDANLVTCYPNPFNNATRVNYIVRATAGGRYRLKVYDLLGRQINTLVDQDLPAGHYSLIWNGADERGVSLGSGIYILKLNGPDFQRTQKIIILR
ncbi:MAG: T9SS type A sorting domain-containing protein [Candidatus Neomarinimicrobiota bacterium]